MKIGKTEFIRTKYDGLDGKTKVAVSSSPGTFQIISDQMGINFRGELPLPIGTQNELEEFAKLVAGAWSDHSRLTPKLTKTVSGH